VCTRLSNNGVSPFAHDSISVLEINCDKIYGHISSITEAFPRCVLSGNLFEICTNLALLSQRYLLASQEIFGLINTGREIKSQQFVWLGLTGLGQSRV
jgi:hypothetical protein